MICLDENMVSELIEGLLPPATAATLRQHLQQCGDCRRLVSALARGSASVPAAPLEVEAGRPRGTLIDRYVVLHPVGVGAMGLVYAAYDPDLDRRVALKLVRVPASGEEAEAQRARLLREARAMARLTDGNVITVHDVGLVEDQLFVAMELVDGGTLGDWRRERARSWSEVMSLCVAAGRGLAAAHHAGLVHRDFKPDNVLVGRDGRILVTDFGLAGSVADAESAAPAAVAMIESARRELADSVSLTRTGELVGTPAYMSPEQLAGARADARSDQFSFCVTLHEALYDQRPFAGDTLADLAQAIAAGAIRPAPAGASVPAWLRAAVLRGLHAAPPSRYPSMDELLAALVPPSPPRWRGLALGAAVIVVAGGALVSAALGRDGGSDAGPTCSAAPARLASAWNPQQRDAAARAFTATGVSYAGDVWQRTARTLDAYGAAWSAMHTEACEASLVRHEQSPELHDLRQACLAARLDQMKALVDIFARADATVVDKAIDAAAGLPSLAPCKDVAGLRAAPAPPSDPATRAAVDRLRGDLRQALALRSAGKIGDALGRVTAAAAEARVVGDPGLTSELLLRQGEFLGTLGDDGAAESLLYQAIGFAEAAGRDDVRAQCWTELTSNLGYKQNRIDEARRASGYALAILQRRPGELEQRAYAHNNLGLALVAAGTYDAAVVEIEQARTLLAQHDPHSPSLLVIEGNLGDIHRTLGHYDAAVAILERVLVEIEAKLGADHPRLADAQVNLANALAEKGNYDAAVDLYHQAIALLRRSYGPDHPGLAITEGNLGIVLWRAERLDESLAATDRALAIYEAAGQGDGPAAAGLLANRGGVLFQKKDFAGARAAVTSGLERLERSLGPTHPLIADPLLSLAEITAAEEVYATALPLARRAAAILESANGDDHARIAPALTLIGHILVSSGKAAAAIAPLERALPMWLASGGEATITGQIQLTLAAALWDGGGDRERARALGEQARDTLRATGDAGAEQLGHAESWLAEHPR